jgi:hypothetical protein
MPSRQPSIEYRLLVHHTYDETLKKPGVLFLLETSKQFTNFSYRIAVKERFDGKHLEWTLHGLQAPSMNMPETGTAQFSTVYFDAPRTIEFTLIKKEKIRTSVMIKVLKHSVTATPAAGFLKVYTDKEEFDAQRQSDTQAPVLKPDVHRAPPKKIPTTTKKKNE